MPGSGTWPRRAPDPPRARRRCAGRGGRVVGEDERVPVPAHEDRRPVVPELEQRGPGARDVPPEVLLVDQDHTARACGRRDGGAVELLEGVELAAPELPSEGRARVGGDEALRPPVRPELVVAVGLGRPEPPAELHPALARVGLPAVAGGTAPELRETGDEEDERERGGRDRDDAHRLADSRRSARPGGRDRRSRPSRAAAGSGTSSGRS